MNQYPKNPFALLRVSTQASRQEVVERGKVLIEGTDDDELKIVYRKAVEQIISHPFERLVQAVWEVPDTNYEEHDDTWRKFAQPFRSNPVTLNSVYPYTAQFVEENLHPDKLLELLSPLLTISRPTGKNAFALPAPAADDLYYPLTSDELF